MKVAMVLSGAGYLDGSEIRESVLSLLYLDQQAVKVDVFAPDIGLDEVNHQTGEATGAQRNVMVEAARIARGDVRPLAALNMEDYAGLVIPGGFGVAKNLSDLATKGVDCSVLPEFKQAIISTHRLNKPIAAICIAPAVVAAALKGVATPTVTIGEDAGTAGAIESFGAIHEVAQTADSVCDSVNAIYTCSAYMREDAISEVAKGIEKTIQHFVIRCRG